MQPDYLSKVVLILSYACTLNISKNKYFLHMLYLCNNYRYTRLEISGRALLTVSFRKFKLTFQFRGKFREAKCYTALCTRTKCATRLSLRALLVREIKIASLRPSRVRSFFASRISAHYGMIVPLGQF